MPDAELRFYFDVVCPYAYLGSTQIERIARAAGVPLTYRPMLLGGVFKAIHPEGNGQGANVAMSPAKARMNLIDLERWAERWGIEFRGYPPGHPRRSVGAMRLCVAAGPKVAEVARDLFRAYWVEGRALDDADVLAEVAARHGIPIGRIEETAVKEALRANTDEAIGEGVFGAPSFVVIRDGAHQLFWGQDRLQFVEKALAAAAPIVPA